MSQASQAKTRKNPTASAPRRRRKRTVATGATHDCFTCARNGASCDRRRPYCSQCLDDGLECSGYKTTLTWGVGVASRGKLRGLSLPVPDAQPAAGGNPKPRRASGHEEPQSPSNTSVSAPQPYSHPSPVSDSACENALPINIPSPQVQPASWGQPSPAYYLPNNVSTHTLTEHSTDVDSASAQGSWAGSWSPSFQSPPTASWSYSPHAEGTGTDDTNEDERRNCHAYHIVGHHQRSPSFSQLLLARSVGRTPRLRYLISYYAEVIAPVIVAFDSPTNPFRTSILRMAQGSTSLQEAIATLATSNLRQRRERGTFSTERTESARMSSLAHRALADVPVHESSDPSIPEELGHEEQYHRGKAVQELNKELGDPQKRLSDSVLATLLILCLFHVCDTGVGQFKTQFAGVTKLLAIRMRASPYLTDELKWFIRMFTWYDTMTATTNDREIQLHSKYVDLTAATDGEWGLENLAGCDAGLFKVISNLGRLNILSQNQELNTQPSPHIFIPTSAPPPSMAYYTQVDPYLFPLPTPPRPGDQTQKPLSPTFWAEWFSMKQQLEAWRFPQERLNQNLSVDSGFDISPTSSTMHAYMSPPSSPVYQGGIAPQNVEDVFHISESFRHSALLYSERLAYPDLPSSHPRIQQIVQRSMSHISAVKSDVYLLWPLFITGSECVFQEHRMVIEERCKDISKDSGFCNNLSCLELLQNIWANSPPLSIPDANNNFHDRPTEHEMPVYPAGWSVLDDVIALTSSTGYNNQGFRWHQVMQAKRADGEYMVV
ncbi:fungal-specific transcription factor domain-containing protein [Aspergillus crustosus]